MTFLPLSITSPVARASDTVTGFLGGVFGSRFIMDGAPSEGRLSIVEHPIAPRGLAAPMHRHSREDEYSYILEGRWGFQLGDTVVYGEPGDLVYKPRDVWHSFWNAGDEPARILEIISPAGFEGYFVEMASALDAGTPPDFGALREKYGLEMDLDSIPRLVAEHGLIVNR
jgi:quercetin dioxygenase-like cupin family protein